MRFNIVLGNHPREVLNTTRDHTLIIAGGLRDAGHEAAIGLGTAHRDQINLFYDCLDERTAGTYRQLKAGGYRFGIVCTEIMPGDGTVNGRTDDGARSWLAGLAEVGRLADFVWVMHGPSLESIRALTGNPRCFYLPLGFTPAAREIRHVEPDIDFLFFGKLTRYRAGFLQELANRGHRVEHVYNVPGFIRNALIGRARINLALRQDENWDQPSAGRLSYLVTNRCAVVCDQTANGLPYESYTVRAPAANFVAACEEALRGRAWLSQAEEFAEAFAREQALGPVYAELVQRTFADDVAQAAD